MVILAWARYCLIVHPVLTLAMRRLKSARVYPLLSCSHTILVAREMFHTVRTFSPFVSKGIPAVIIRQQARAGDKMCGSFVPRKDHGWSKDWVGGIDEAFCLCSRSLPRQTKLLLRDESKVAEKAGLMRSPVSAKCYTCNRSITPICL